MSFLHLLIRRKNNGYETEIFRKSTDTGLYTSPESFCELGYKRNMIKGLIYRSWSLSSTFANSIKSIDKLVDILQHNGYSKSFLGKIVRETIDKLYKQQHNLQSNLSDSLRNNHDPGPSSEIDSLDHSLKTIDNGGNDLDIIGDSSYVLSIPYSEGFKHFKYAILKHTNDLKIRLVSKSCKVRSMFNNKSPTPIGLCSDLVYSYSCNGCNATYIGETSRHLCKRVQEHCRKSGKSNIFEHNNICKANIDISKFKILSKSFRNYWERVTCEALYIKENKPKINVQNAVSTCILRVFI